jgi:hypothetical protein
MYILKEKDVAAPYLIIEKSANGYNKPLQMKLPVEVIDNKFCCQITSLITTTTDSATTE